MDETFRMLQNYINKTPMDLKAILEMIPLSDAAYRNYRRGKRPNRKTTILIEMFLKEHAGKVNPRQ